MSYLSLLDDEIAQAQFLVVMKPRRKLGSFTLHSGSVYKIAFDYGEVVSVTIDGVELTAGSSTALSASQYYYDSQTEFLYVRNASSTDPSASYNVATYEIYVGTFDAHHNRVPTDSATRVVYFEPLIVKSPQINSSTSDNIFGFIPVLSTGLTLSNATQLFEKHIYDSSFNQAEIKAWHWLGQLSTDNVKLVLNGVISKISYNTKELNIQCLDKINLFSEEYRNVGSGAKSFYATSDFAGLNPSFKGRPIRMVYGRVDGFIPVNVDYVSNAPSTSDNRDWIVMSGRKSETSVTATVSASPASTTTRTYLSSVVGFASGDSPFFDHTSFPDEGAIITGIGPNYIDHTALVNAMVAGETVTREAIAQVWIAQNNVKYQAIRVRDYTVNDTAARTIGFSFTTSMESNLGIPATLSPNDRVWVRAYGKKNDVTLGGPAFGANDTTTGNLTHTAAIMVDLLKSGVGVLDAEINSSSFTTFLGLSNQRVSFAIPQLSTENFPTYKDLFSDLMGSSITKMYLDNDSKWKVTSIAPLGADTKTIDDTEILLDSVEYEFDYSELISDVIVEYAFREAAEDLSVTGSSTLQVTSEMTNATYLHKVKKQKTFHSLHYIDTDAQDYAGHLGYIFSERMGKLSIQTKNRFFDTLLSDIIQVSREALPGFEYVSGTERTRSFSVVETQKSLAGITIVMDDQKGIEDNSGSW